MRPLAAIFLAGTSGQLKWVRSFCSKVTQLQSTIVWWQLRNNYLFYKNNVVIILMHTTIFVGQIVCR